VGKDRRAENHSDLNTFLNFESSSHILQSLSLAFVDGHGVCEPDRELCPDEVLGRITLIGGFKRQTTEDER